MAEAAGSGGDQLPNAVSEVPTALVRQAQQGDEDAFRSLYRALHPELLHYAAFVAGPDAEAVAGGCWPYLAQELLRFEGDGPAFRRLALATVRDRAEELPRRRRRQRDSAGKAAPATTAPPVPSPAATGPAVTGPATAPGHDNSGPGERAGTADDGLPAREAISLIASLPKNQAEAVLLRVVFQLDTESTAEILGKRPGAVAAALSRGLKKLARLLEQPGTTALRR